MRFLQYETGPDDCDRRLDRVLRRFLPDTGLGELYKAIRKGLIRINDRKTTQNYRIQSQDIICIADFLVQPVAMSSPAAPAAEFPFPVLFRNDRLLVINKPYDIPVQKAARGETALDDLVKRHFPGTGDSLSFTPGPLHRLDKKTTGVLCFSQNISGAHLFSTLIKTHEVTKTYVAVLAGTMTHTETWTDYISRDGQAPQKGFHTVSVSSEEQDGGKESITRVTPVATGSWKGMPVTFAGIDILTGRTHQIRSQCAAHGFPLLGDTAYGGPAMKGAQDFFLHALSLSFPPECGLGVPRLLTAPLPPAFSGFLRQTFSADSLGKIDFFTVQSYNDSTD